MKVLSRFNFFLFLFISQTFSKELTKTILAALQDDIKTLDNHREDYLHLNCKILTLAHLRYYYEEKIIDEYIKKTNKMEEFLSSLQEAMLKKCKEKNTSTNEIFETYMHSGYNPDSLHLTEVSLPGFLSNFTANFTMNIRDEL